MEADFYHYRCLACARDASRRSICLQIGVTTRDPDPSGRHPAFQGGSVVLVLGGEIHSGTGVNFKYIPSINTVFKPKACGLGGGIIFAHRETEHLNRLPP